MLQQPNKQNEKLNGEEVKQKILNFLDTNGPSLPIQIARHISLETLFASAFLSELSSQKRIRISNLKVGGSPLYFTSSKANLLENFSQHLGNKEKEAFFLLKEKHILQDDIQTPAIRVALRSLKDFAFPFKIQDKIFWRYFTISEEESKELTRTHVITKINQEITPQSLPQTSQPQQQISQQTLPPSLIPQPMPQPQPKKQDELQLIKEKQQKKPRKKLVREDFLNEVKVFLIDKGAELLKIESFDKKQVFARIKLNNQEYLLAAFNKKKLDNLDILKANKKASALSLEYILFSKGELSKKTKEAIEAYKKLAGFDIIKQENAE